MRIAAVCAYPAKFNNGMLSVDLALKSFLARHGIVADVTNFAVGPDLSIAGGLDYRSLTGWEELEEYDRVLFWGDFLHARRYHQQDLRNRGLTEVGQRALLLEGAPDALLEKVVCFGGTIYINQLTDLADERYVAALTRLYGKARLVLMRDPISAVHAVHFGAQGATGGVDCALLLRPEAQAGGPAKQARIGFSIGRGPSKRRIYRFLMRRLAERLRRSIGAEAIIDLDWLERNESAPPADPLGSLEAKLGELRSCTLVVTDTYHCAVSAWREGVPAIAIGRGTQHATRTLSDKKKELFFAMFGAADLYVYLERLARWGGIESAAEQIEAALPDADTVKHLILTATDRAETQLAEALRD